MLMSTPPFTVGRPVLLDGPPPPLEGARLLLDGPVPRLLVVYHEPTPEEIAAVQLGRADLGLYHRDGVAALAARFGEPTDPARVEVLAPLVLFGRSVDPGPPALRTAQVALCDAARLLVRSLRSVSLPAAFLHAARCASRVQTARFASAAAAVRAHEAALRALTVPDALRCAVARAHLRGPRTALANG
ncbi:hypothetical protein BSZ36_17075 [Rubricoccus marinus]|uniref:Uncharacterized protein n=2 Tax=Rubricoccus marinus TaxID=716817 RepID=A0A259TUG7_9BACT|nr:hypothetical protein BSZ36_17075 [Rubricoccus marinus]